MAVRLEEPQIRMPLASNFHHRRGEIHAHPIGRFHGRQQVAERLAVARERLARWLEIAAVPPRPRRETRPSGKARERRLEEKRRAVMASLERDDNEGSSEA